jgi:protein-S-isoprenylcysteine O-methyltransferase Ste14
MAERTHWIEFVPVWDDSPDAPEVTIEILESDPAQAPSGDRFFLSLSLLVAFVGLGLGALVAVIGAADGSVILPGGRLLPSAVLVGVGVVLAFVEAILLVLAWRRIRSRSSILRS